MIPRVFHHIWLGPQPLPSDFAAFRETWREKHPDWELRLWTDETLPEGLDRREVYDLTRLPAERADVLRLELLARDGGVYVDADLECRKPVDDLIAGLDFFACSLGGDRGDGSGWRVGNGIIGATPGHRILTAAAVEVRVSENGRLDKSASGTVFFTELLKRFPDAHVFDRPVFYPLTRAEQREAYAIHHWSRSWKTPEELRASLFKAETRLAEANERIEQLEMELAQLRRTPRRRLLR